MFFCNVINITIGYRVKTKYAYFVLFLEYSSVTKCFLYFSNPGYSQKYTFSPHLFAWKITNNVHAFVIKKQGLSPS